MHINLRSGEKLYLNGAVLRADRKVSLELMNDAVFLLEAHVISPDKATTPLRQLYFIVQMMLMCPQDAGQAHRMFATSLEAMTAAYDDPRVREVLAVCAKQVAKERFFDALKGLRGAFALDDALLGRSPAESTPAMIDAVAPTSASQKAA